MANQLLPVVRLFFPCERADFSPDEQAYVLTGPLAAVGLPTGASFPYECLPFSCYTLLSDAVGTFGLSIAVLYEDSDRVLYRTGTAQITFPPRGRIVARDVAFILEDVRFPRAGLYRLQLMCNQVALPDGFWDLRVL